MSKKYFIIIGLLLISCVHEPGSVCSYAIHIKPIIATRCAVSGCHGQGSSLGDFTIDSVLKARADMGLVRRNVFELKIMPPASATPLTDDEKQRLKCWLDNGAPQD